MKKNIRKTRKLKKTLRPIMHLLESFLSIPFVKPALIMIHLICILLVLAPFVLTKISPAKDKPEIELIPKSEFKLKELPAAINVYRSHSDQTEMINFEDYVKGVASCEMPSSFHMEALKAQAVAARTYSLARVLNAEQNGNPNTHPGAPLCDTTHCQVYKSPEELKKLKGSQWMKDGWKKINNAVDQTRGQLLYYNGQLVKQALFHSSSGGKTENSEDVFASAVPYLVSVESPYENNATHSSEKNSFSISNIISALNNRYPDIHLGSVTPSNIEILSRSSGNRVEDIRIGEAILQGKQIREALELPSANFTLDITDNIVTFTSNGFGHGVGMSQYGANGMAEKGYDYKDILSHYYSGTEVF